MNKIFAFLPCYNEELNIGKLIEKWEQQTEELSHKGYRLIVVGIDDCSTDNTKQVILEKVQQYDNVQLIAHSENRNLCGGLNTSVNYFLTNGNEGDFMVLMDGDNTHDPTYIQPMLKKLLEESKDCVIASRYCNTSIIYGVAKHRELMSDLAKLYYSSVLRVPGVKDYTCGYRIYTYQIIKKLIDEFGTEPVTEKSFACMMELLYKIYLVGGNFGEVGFTLRYDNKQGESKMKIIKTVQKSLLTALKLRKQKHE